MSWNYQARKTVYKTGDYEETLFELVEAYPDIDGDGPCHTVNGVSPVGESQQDLADWLRKAADDVENYPVIDGNKE